MKSSSQLLVLGVLWPLSAAAADSATAGEAPVLPDTSQWTCESCPAEKGATGTMDVGVGNVSSKSGKFGEYNGLNEKGAVFIGDGSGRYRGEDGRYWNADAVNLGLRSRAIGVEGGQQGRYKLNLDYDEIPHVISDTAQTPYSGTGGNSLTLPGGFGGATTSAMPLATTLHPVDLETQRKRLGIGGSWIASPDWQYSLNVRHETKDGTKRTAGAFFVNSAQLVEPVDYTTDQLDASASYTGQKLQAKFSYYGSLFRNGNSSLTFQNPFTGLPGSPTAGQLALAPDNQFHQVLASVGYQLTDRTRATGDIAYGRMTQNEAFLAPTLNTALGAPALPRSSLDGQANTLNANLKLNSSVTSDLRLNALYSHNERDNRTPQATYSGVSTDMFLATARTNLPYSFKQDKINLSADYRITGATRTSVGLDHDSNKRTFQEAETTRENTVWGKVASRAMENLDLSVKVARAERRNSGYNAAVVPVVPPENPLLRKYHLANRSRESIALRADIAATDNVNIGLGASNARDVYSDSTIGLTSGSDFAVNGDISVAVSEDTSLHFFANREVIRSKQAGSQVFSTPDWTGDNTDTVDFYGVGLRHVAIKNKLDIGADYGQTRTRSEINVNTGAGAAGFPNITSTLESFRLYATYKLKDNMSLNASFWHDRFDSRNWMFDNVAPGTIPNVLTLGELPPRYSINFVRLSVRYRF
jgi:MtrB/PioB family decaheme-associated outer membrane protein